MDSVSAGQLIGLAIVIIVPVDENNCLVTTGQPSLGRRSVALTSPHLLGPAPGKAFTFLAFLLPLGAAGIW